MGVPAGSVEGLFQDYLSIAAVLDNLGSVVMELGKYTTAKQFLCRSSVNLVLTKG